MQSLSVLRSNITRGLNSAHLCTNSSALQAPYVAHLPSTGCCSSFQLLLNTSLILLQISKPINHIYIIAGDNRHMERINKLHGQKSGKHEQCSKHFTNYGTSKDQEFCCLPEQYMVPSHHQLSSNFHNTENIQG